jgi:hypothetical protein
MRAIRDSSPCDPMNDFNCPACTAPGLVDLSPNVLACPYCDSTFQHDLLTCPACRALNEPQAEYCEKCGEPLTLVSQVMLRHSGAGVEPLRLRQSRARAAELKERGEQASARRMHELQEIDRRREETVAKAEADRTRLQKKALSLAITIGFLFILFIVILTAWQLLA